MDSKSKFTLLKQQHQQNVDLKKITNHLPHDLVLSIWKRMVFENIELTELIPLVKEGSAFNSVVFDILQENSVVLEVKQNYLLITIRHVTGYITYPCFPIDRDADYSITKKEFIYIHTN
ncbi:unnamed protein product [Ambrosiozyma monospora]|uniref:Unnamed protein product n=1 Tax=Ambrosiozyma monospora TaxID=43982 RepID=A0ACB5T9R7_AMBMO|nr:unnamed protein product [Ambrosiozyma monospora]